MFADPGEEQATQKAPALDVYDNLPRKQQQTSSLKRPVQPDAETIPGKKPKPSRTAVLPGFGVTLAAAEDKGHRHEMEDVAVMQLDARPDAGYPWRQASRPDAAKMQPHKQQLAWACCSLHRQATSLTNVDKPCKHDEGAAIDHPLPGLLRLQALLHEESCCHRNLPAGPAEAAGYAA